MRSLALAACVVGLLGTSTANAAFLELATTVRDFTPTTHADFERFLGDDRGIVATTLGGDNKPVFAGGTHPSITSKELFDQFYRDTPNVNIAIPKTLRLDETAEGSGVYRYSNTSYFPIDNEGFGNYSTTGRNFHFTTEIHTTFSYKAGQTFLFRGDDDLWMFIDKKLVIDLGGVHVAQEATVNLDTLGLTPGSTYQLDIFHAERHTSQSNFTMETSIVLAPVPEPTSIGLISVGVLGLLAINRRKRKSA